MGGPTRVVIAHVVVTLLGAGFLLWQAQPVTGSLVSSLPNAGFWQLLGAAAVVVGGVGGLVEGIALRLGRPGVAVVVLVVAAVPGLWLPLLTLGRWFPSQQGDLVEAGLVVGAEAGWLALMAVLAATASLLGRRGGRRRDA